MKILQKLIINKKELAGTEEGPHLWPKRLPIYPHNIFPYN